MGLEFVFIYIIFFLSVVSQRADLGKNVGQRRQIHPSTRYSFWREYVQHLVVETSDGQRRDMQLVQSGKRLRLFERTENCKSRYNYRSARLNVRRSGSLNVF